MPGLQDETIAGLTKLLVEAAQPKRIILFGSRARGDASEDSDVDIMVAEERLPNRLGEMVRLNRHPGERLLRSRLRGQGSL